MRMALRDGASTAELLSTRRGRAVFTVVAGAALLQTVTAVKLLGEVINTWVSHTDATGAPIPPGEDRPRPPSYEDIYDSCTVCYFTVDRRASMCPACRTARDPNPVTGADGGAAAVSRRDTSGRPTGRETPQLVVDVEELSRP